MERALLGDRGCADHLPGAVLGYRSSETRHSDGSKL